GLLPIKTRPGTEPSIMTDLPASGPAATSTTNRAALTSDGSYLARRTVESSSGSGSSNCLATSHTVTRSGRLRRAIDARARGGARSAGRRALARRRKRTGMLTSLGLSHALPESDSLPGIGRGLERVHDEFGQRRGARLGWHGGECRDDGRG